MRHCVILIAVFSTFAPVAQAQEPAYRDDMRFAEALRNRGDNDLALEFLQQIAKGAPPEVLKELSLEFAKTRLRVAADEPETAKRLAQYRSAQADFQKFIAENPGHPRLAEANIDIARVLNFQGKTELNQAMLAEDAKTRRDIAQQARATLEGAAGKLAAAGKELEAAAGRLPDPDSIKDLKEKREAEAARFRAEGEVKQTEYDRALNLYDQASAFILINNDEAASKLLGKAKEMLDPLAAGEPKQPITWKARAWLGRVLAETETPDKAHAKFIEVRNAGSNPAAYDGIRLARYFQLKVYREKPRPSDKNVNTSLILPGASSWRRDYPRYFNTPEGHGLTFLYAQTLLNEAANNKKLAAAVQAQYRRDARTLLREIENSENEFTDQARRLKIEVMNSQGLFKMNIARITGFENCFVRAQFEAMQLGREKDAEKRKVHINNIMAALQKALASPEVKAMRPGLELNSARSMFTYWALTTNKLPEAIQTGEQFAREDPRSSQAEMSAVYALQAYGQVVRDKLSKDADAEDAKEYRQRMFSLAGYMEDRWPTSVAGDLARHSVGLQLFREGNFREAVKKLSLISPGYGSFTLVCFQIADACNKAEKAGLDPIAGDQKGDYKKRALRALSTMPESALGADPFTNHLTISGKAMLGVELYRLKRFQQMDDLAAQYLARVDKLRFNDDDEKDKGIRTQMHFELAYVKVLARYGLAEAAFQAGDFARVVELLDPLVNAAAGGDSQEKANLQKNQQLGMALLVLALRSNIQLGNIERTEAVLGVIEGISSEDGPGAGATNILKLLAFLIRAQIDDLRKKGDKVALDKAIAGYSKILDKRIAKGKPTLDFTRAVAECYASMGKHAEAAAVLEKAPRPGAKAGADEEKNYRAIQLLLSRQYRLSGTKANIEKARKLMTGIMAGWGQQDLMALMEDGRIMEAEEKYPEAFSRWGKLVKRLERAVARGGPIKDRFLECSVHRIGSYSRIGLTKTSKEDRDKYVGTAAQQLAALEASWGDDFGSEGTKKLVAEMLAADPALKEQYEALRKKK